MCNKTRQADYQGNQACIHCKLENCISQLELSLIFICSDIDGSIGWYNAIRPALKSFLKSRLGKSLLNKLSGFFKRVLNSLWKGKVKDLWNTLIEWIRSRDPVSSHQEITTACFLYWLRNHIYPCNYLYSVILQNCTI